MKKNLTTLVAALLALTMLAAACGGSDDESASGGGDTSAQDQEVIDAVAAQISEEGDVPDELDVDCFARALVRGLGGAEVMESEYGLTAETISEGDSPEDEVELPVEEARSLADGMFDCGMMDVMVSEMTGDGISGADAECMVANLDGDVFRDVMATEFMSPEDAVEIEEAAGNQLISSMGAIMANCDLDPSVLGG